MDDVDYSTISLDQLNIGIEAYLEKKTGVCRVSLEEKKPADRHSVLTWEQRNCCLLPEDLKNFYLTTNGFHFTWSVKLDNHTVPVGKMHINPVEELARIDVFTEKHTTPSLADLETDSDSEDAGIEKPSLIGHHRVYELDSGDGYSKVCLVYREAKPGLTEPTVDIWFLDRALRWHFLASSFLEYYRLMLMHLGLPQWQYAFTDIGLSAQGKQWFSMFAPIRLEVDGEVSEHAEVEAGKTATEGGAATCILDINKVFKSRGDRKKQAVPTGQSSKENQQQGGKKKPPVSSARSQGSLSSKLSQGSSFPGIGKGPK